MKTIHWRDAKVILGKLSKCGANRGLNRHNNIVVTDNKRKVTCLSCRSFIPPWERGDRKGK